MFMFRRRRAALVRSLLKARVRRRPEDTEQSDVRVLLMKRLGEPELETLHAAVESRGGTAGCVLTDPAGPDPRLVSVRAWRWPDVESSAALKKLPVCRSAPGSPCCNPYHWSRLCTPGTYTLLSSVTYPFDNETPCCDNRPYRPTHIHVRLATLATTPSS